MKPVQIQPRSAATTPAAALFSFLALLSPATAADPQPALPGTPAKPSAPSQAGWLNEALRSRDPAMARWNLGAFYWTRYEIKENAGFVGPGSAADFRTDVDNDNSYLLQKVLLRAGYSGDAFDVFAQGRHSSVTGDDRSSSGNSVLSVSTNGTVTAAGPVGGGSSPESDGPLDLQQAWILWGKPAASPVSLKLGRQEFILGEHRLVGPLPWNNIQRQWDAARLTCRYDAFVADAWSSMLVMPRDNRFNEPNPDEIFSGVNAGTGIIPKVWTEASFLARNVGRDANRGDRGLTPAPFRPPEAQDIYTVGLTFRNSTNDWKHVDFGAQLYGQFGDFADAREAAGNGPRREHRAYAAILAGGYTWKESPGKPRLGLEYAHASGDTDPADGTHETFVHLYPTGHLFYGYADLSSLQNLHNIRLRSSITPLPPWRIQLEGHLRWLATTHDNFYNVAGLPRGGMTTQSAAERGNAYGINPDASGYVGSEIDLVSTWQLGRFVVLEAAYCRFFRGDYIRDSLARVGSTDAHYVYIQLQANF